MTPPGGSRDDDADNDPRREVAPGRSRSGEHGAPPAAGDDARDGEHDPQLRAMRAVWLTMRDEDPPDRGLAQLLAAARHKAEAMQPRPSAWQRLLAALRRPPVLALATVTVLIAGAVLISRRLPQEAARGSTAAREPAGPTRPAALDTGAGSPGGNVGARPELTGAHSTEQAAADPGDARTGRAPQPAAPPPPPTARQPDHGGRPALPAPIPTSPPPSMSPAADTPGAPGDQDNDRAAAGAVPAASPPPADPAPGPAPSPPDRVTQLGASAAVPVDTTGSNARNAARPPRKEQQAQPPAGASNDARNDPMNNARNNTASPVANGTVAPARRPAPAPPRSDAGGDLYQQCEVAARRSDCAAVRRFVAQITRSDPGYRARVAKDSPVGRCLAE